MMSRGGGLCECINGHRAWLGYTGMLGMGPDEKAQSGSRLLRVS